MNDFTSLRSYSSVKRSRFVMIMAILFFIFEKDIFIWYAVPYLQPKTEIFLQA
jgi:hypothetical protein